MESISIASWDLIVWTIENTVDCIPSSWAVSKCSRTKYLYPKNLRKSKILKQIKNCTPPSSKYNYLELEARFKKTIYNYNHAETYLKKMELTSNVEEDEDCEEVIDAISQPAFLYDCPNVQIEEREDKLDTIQSLLTNVVSKMQSMEVTLNELKVVQSNVQIAVAALNPNAHRDLRFNDWNIPLPIKDAEDFEKAENLLPEKDYILVNLLALVGGLTLRHNITLMVKKLLSKAVACQYSAHGRKGKKNFSQTKFFPVLIEAARLKDKTATDVIISQYIGNALAGVKDWEGGYARPHTNKENVPVENVGDPGIDEQ